LTEKKRGTRPTGGAGDGSRPKIPTSHTGRPRDVRRPARASRPGVRGTSNGAARPRLAPATGGPRVRKARTGSSPAPSASIASDSARTLAIRIATAALEKKALRVEVLDVAGKVDYADFLVLMTGRSDRQVQAIAQGIEEELKKHGKRPQAIEGLPHAQWVLMDYIDVVVHVFQDDARGAYDLDGLWMDARRIVVTEGPGVISPTGGPEDER
jgi:ribosome-associated protein